MKKKNLFVLSLIACLGLVGCNNSSSEPTSQAASEATSQQASESPSQQPSVESSEPIAQSEIESNSIEESSPSDESNSIEESSPSDESSSISESSSPSQEEATYHINFENATEGTVVNETTFGNYTAIDTQDKGWEIATTAEGATLGETVYTKYLKTGGSSSTKAGSEYRVLKFTTTGRGTVTVTARTGSAGGSERSIFAYQVEKGVEQDSKVVDEIGVYELTLHYGGTFYLGATNNVHIFEIDVTYEDGVNDEWEPPISLNDPNQLNASELPAKSFEENTEIGNFVINAKLATDKQEVVVDGNSKEYDGVKYSKRIKLGGAGTYDYRSITINTTGAARITVVCMSSNSSTPTVGTLYNTAVPMEEEGAQVDVSAEITGAELSAYVFFVTEAGSYCFMSTGSKGINIYNIIIESVIIN